jgi:hypothetical protein
MIAVRFTNPSRPFASDSFSPLRIEEKEVDLWEFQQGNPDSDTAL